MKRLVVGIVLMLSILQLSDLYAQDEDDASAMVNQSDNDAKNDDESAKTPILEDALHEEHLDTLDIEGSGNWLKKRIIYQQAQIEFDEVLSLVNKVVDMRMQFTNEVNLIGHKIDDFYTVVDFDKGELDAKFKSILSDLDMEQKLKGDLSEKESELQASIKQQLSTIEQLGQNIKSIGDLDRKLDQVLMQAFKTIDECRDYEARSWTAFKAIAKEIDDKKARNLYYEINNFKQNIDQKKTYLSSSLLPYLHNVLIAKIESNIAKIKDSIEQLKQKGLDLSVIMKSEQEADIELLKQREKESIDLAVEKALSIEQEKEEQKQKKEKAIALEKARKATWSYKLSQLSDVIGLTYVAKQFETYSYPVASFLYEKWAGFKGFISGSVGSWMNYFKRKDSVTKNNIEYENIQSDIDQVQDISAAVLKS